MTSVWQSDSLQPPCNDDKAVTVISWWQPLYVWVGHMQCESPEGQLYGEPVHTMIFIGIRLNILFWQTVLQRTHDATITSLLRKNDAITSFWRNNDVVVPSRVRWSEYITQTAGTEPLPKVPSTYNGNFHHRWKCCCACVVDFSRESRWSK